MTPRAALVLCTDERWCEEVRSSGGNEMVVHEARVTGTARPVRHDPMRVLVVGRFTADEPIAEVVEAARMVPDCQFSLTGEPNRCPPEARAVLPPNTTLVSVMGPNDYRRAVADADVVLTLTTEPTSVMRAAYEAVYARRPLIVSDWPIDRVLFPQALHAANERARPRHRGALHERPLRRLRRERGPRPGGAVSPVGRPAPHPDRGDEKLSG